MPLNWLYETLERAELWCFIGRERIKKLRLLLPYAIGVPLSHEMKAYVDAMAIKYGVPATEVILRALFTFRFLNSALERDGVLVIEYANGEVETIVKL
jgi:hypothetical protein